ncbi:DoxX family protein [Nocardia sp. NPDC050412]|uniref:DoxX family protein n=1 Tax=Nocardia sp. NPDC050412 TaxID=3364320 RepID=UPI0037A58B51
MSTNGNWLARSAATTVPGSVVLIGRGLSLRRHSEVAGPETLGTGRFDKADISAAGFVAALDGVFEIGCGALIPAGLLTRLVAIPMIVDMIGALLITKLPIL